MIMNANIQYSDLSGRIKKEVDSFFNENVKSDNTMSREEAFSVWFETRFDTWLQENFLVAEKTKRKHLRFDIEIPVKVVERIIDEGEPEAESLDYVGTVLNLSRGGFYFQSAEMFSVSSIIKVILDLSIINAALGNLEALAMVVRRDLMDNRKYGIGVMFSSIYGGEEKNLDVLILKNVAYHISAG